MKNLKFFSPILFLFFCSCASKVRLADTNLARQYLDSAQVFYDLVHYDESLVYGEKALKIYREKLKTEDTLAAKAYFQIGKTLTKKAKYDEALEHHQEALRIRHFTFENENAETANSLYNIGKIFSLKAEYDSAMIYYQEALEIRLNIFGRYHKDVAWSYCKIGATHSQQSNYTLASEFIEDAFEIQQKVLEANHIDLADSYYWLGEINAKQNNFPEAFDAWSKAVEIMEIHLSEGHPRLVNCYSVLAVHYHMVGEFEKSLEYINKSTQAPKDEFGFDNPEYGAFYFNIGMCYLHRTEYENALLYFELTKNIREKSFGEKSIQTAHAYYGLGNAFVYLAKYDESLYYLRRAKGIYEQKLPENHPRIIDNYQTIGLIYYIQGRFDKALSGLNTALEMSLQKYGEMTTVSLPICTNIGLCHTARGEYYKALQFHQQALSICLKNFPKDHYLVGQSYNNIGLVYLEINEYQKALEFVTDAKSIYLKNPDVFQRQLPRLYINMGNIYTELNQPDSAFLYFQTGFNIDTLIFGNEHPSTVFDLSSIATAYVKEDKYDDAIALYQKALKIETNIYGPKHLDGAILNYDIGLCYGYKNQNEQGLKYFQQALNIERDILGPTHPSLAKNYFRIGNIFQKDNKFIKANEYFDSSQVCLANIGRYFSSSLSKRTQLANIHFIYAEMIEAQIASDHSTGIGLQTAFSLSEKAKSIILLEAIHASQAKYFANLPDSLIQQEKEFQQEIVYFDKLRQELLSQDLNETDSAVLVIDNKLFEINNQLENLLTKFENYPAFYKAKYDFSTVDVDYVQKQLFEENQSMIEYFVGDSSIFLFLVQKDTFEVHEIKHDFPLKDWVQEMTKDGIYGYYTAPTSKRTRDLEEKTIVNYTNAAQQLYEKLTGPVANKLTENVIIIPDGVLGYVPFEALLTEAPPRIGAFKAYPFMLKKYQICYCYSATLLREMQQKKHSQEPSGQLLAMAPFSQDDVSELVAQTDSTDLLAISLRDSLGTLPGSGEEVAVINTLWNGTSIFGSEASLAEFHQKASDYRILHLSTHGKADDRVGDYAYLGFGVPDEQGTFDKLYARDLYNYSLNADMVVLSACETGIGKLQKGEGIISLSRAFAYAGAKSIFTTLWQVSDEKTKDIFISFYNYLKKGKSKDEALRLAKLDYLKANAGKGQGTHPFFWAGLIGIGDMSVIPSKNN